MSSFPVSILTFAMFAYSLAITAQGSTFSTSIFQMVCNDTNAPPFDARCNQTSPLCTSTSLPLHVCLNSTEFNVSVKILDCYSIPAHHLPPNIVVAVYEGTRTCEGVDPVIQHQPIGKCMPVEGNVFVQNMCGNPEPAPSPNSSASSSSSSFDAHHAHDHDDKPAPEFELMRKYFFVDGRRYSEAISKN
ncbi:Hypothetical protein, putative [Bodo saltans]|uniref:Membrane-associated protein n=1 Tax=Bodo saltans TaxID=75058 RepID=A0A0S4ISD1_BODSA|nr:Hypothetical protein, putative [Bodo saltans]|eukprot:CUF65142.1 Hypothetical protein, putative [Bodo saltans]